MLNFILGFEILLSMIIFWRYEFFETMLECENLLDFTFLVLVRFIYIFTKVNVILFLLGLSFYLMITGVKE